MKNITGNRYGFLTAVKYVKKTLDGHAIWEYKCDCGNLVERRSNDVPRKNNQNCGCKRSELNPSRSHGFSGTRFYKIWGCIKNRCLDKNTPYYKNYGGRGITVCDRWNTFENFRDDMYETYNLHVSKFGEVETTIDRINTNGNYEPGNCRWATNLEQNRNRRTNRYITINNETKTLSEWARYFNISIQLMFYRASDVRHKIIR